MARTHSTLKWFADTDGITRLRNDEDEANCEHRAGISFIGKSKGRWPDHWQWTAFARGYDWSKSWERRGASKSGSEEDFEQAKRAAEQAVADLDKGAP